MAPAANGSASNSEAAAPAASADADWPTVYVVDDDAAVRALLAAMVQTARIKTIASGSAEEFLSSFDSQPASPRCLLLDLNMPGLSGLGLQARLAAECVSIPVIFVTGQADLQTAVEAMKRGAFDFVEKPVHVQVLVDKVRRALDFDAQNQLQRHRSQDLTSKLQSLSSRERDVMELLLQAKNTKEIAASLGIGVQTVSKHRAGLLNALQIRNDVELVQLVGSHT